MIQFTDKLNELISRRARARQNKTIKNPVSSQSSAVLGEKKTGIPRWSASSIKIKDDQKLSMKQYGKKKKKTTGLKRSEYTGVLFNLG